MLDRKASPCGAAPPPSPFALPCGGDLLRMRHAEAEARREARAAAQAPGVAAKATACSARRVLPRHVRPAPPEPPPESRAGLLRTGGQGGVTTTTPPQLRPSALQGCRAALLAASRDLFRLHCAAEEQRSALAAAAAEAAAREAHLRSAESRFDADALRFDAFLRDSDAALREARADAAAERARADWLAERFAPPGWRIIWAAEAAGAPKALSPLHNVDVQK